MRATVMHGSRGGKTNILSFRGVFRWRHIVSLALWHSDQPGAALRQVRCESLCFSPEGMSSCVLLVVVSVALRIS